MSTIYIHGDTTKLRQEIIELAAQAGSVSKLCKSIPGVSESYLSSMMRGVLPPNPKLLDFMGYDRIFKVIYVHK